MDEPKHHHKRSKEKKEKKKHKKEKKSKIKKKEKKQKDKELKRLAKAAELSKTKQVETTTTSRDREEEPDFSVPIDLMYSKSHVPETPEEYQKRQSQIRRIIDPETGRTRLIKGDGEVLEEIVSKDRHKEINKQATEGDGRNFQSKTVGSLK
ncbi:ADP-ribosylation factor-like protein 6-interacting protein 4 [Eupeodes corollae]|uniref:ADP-ribosylation factor-like protein 6-interacting protein 4 n=1 Tax=Eupeodes corollae TaxID=290404 RepID=UPI002493467C|nr:ADP-ribosylation factor-like protein 6-interacting protein 4 [Eupeodes corollae]